MQVLCIDNKNGEQLVCEVLIKEGNKYNAWQCPVFEDCYRLEEVPVDPATGRLVAFTKKRFIPTSGLCEKEIAEARIAVDAAELDAEYYNLVEEIENA